MTHLLLQSRSRRFSDNTYVRDSKNCFQNFSVCCVDIWHKNIA